MRTKSTRRVKRRRPRAEQLQLPFEETDIRHNKKVRGVYRDRNAHHAIVYKIGKNKISFVEMKKGRLVTRALPDVKFFNERQFERIEYPLERAVENFLKHGSGVSAAAQRALLTFLQEARQDGRAPLPLFS